MHSCGFASSSKLVSFSISSIAAFLLQKKMSDKYITLLLLLMIAILYIFFIILLSLTVLL